MLAELFMILVAFFTAKDYRIHPHSNHMTSINAQSNHIQVLYFIIKRVSRGIQIEKLSPN